MSASDVRDILQIPRAGPSAPVQPLRLPKKEKRPDGITRELYALIGDNAPSLALAKPKMKGKPRMQRKVAKWTRQGFTNQARKDDLQLSHWARDAASTSSDADYAFVKYNTASASYSYSNDEYLHILRDDDWTHEETDHLFDLARQYDLRFVLMADRWAYTDIEGKVTPRTVEDLKARYYSVCRKLIRARPQTDESAKSKLLTEYAFDKSREIARKAYLTTMLSRTPAQIAEEDFLYVESRRLEQNYAKHQRDRENLLRLLGGPLASNAHTGIGGGTPAGAVGLASPGTPLGISKSSTNYKKGRKGEYDDPSADDEASLERRAKANPLFDAQYCITRNDASLARNTLLATGPSVFLRSSRVTPLKPATAPRIGAALAEMGISLRLVMPTANNVARLDGLTHALGSLVDLKRATERAEYEIKVLKQRKVGATSPAAEQSTPAERAKRSASVASTEGGSNKRARM
ncbi:uncharacterized protein L969DRAFT_90693 [Mixia osmundae IAM 14324]|uniref:SWR1-complex protein 4 n=1 Tax=Mixia osmundae (strain CBS 9802 / IAM 14324 / JCM 22182 / KY 12970) TaxID=764103 RepID=G7E1Q7_MIXOS|nr:uncharacterized protein L969DRAFT_90693 [Mixia osmundae IAM 14324]KEI36717.1 hypothetical protein L969DRAFT_90693 [Mixia osmundae IAM 14324]GAA96767.1 hypothetical protein E5Q_03438 [Mixia osmundae IAM 14324]